MARTPSTMPALGTAAADFELPDTVSGEPVSRNAFRGKPLLVMFLSNHCPFVKHIRSKLSELARSWQSLGVGIVGISANDVQSHPEDSPELMREEARQAGYCFPYLFDELQRVAAAYEAACTPDFFLYDANHRLVYRGQFCGSRPGGDIPVTGEDLDRAVRALAGGKTPAPEQRPSLGCNIKWKPGNEPAYHAKR